MIVVGCAELVSVEIWRVDDAPALSSTQKVAANRRRARIINEGRGVQGCRMQCFWVLFRCFFAGSLRNEATQLGGNNQTSV